MAIHPLAGQPAPPDMLLDVARLEREYYEHQPDFSDPNQRVLFGTSGHRGTPSNGTFTEAHILAITQAAHDGVTPVPVISQAILTYNRSRQEHLADALIATPSHSPRGDRGFKYNPPNGGPDDTDVTSWIQQRANNLFETGNREVRRVPYAAVMNRTLKMTRGYIDAHAESK
jgi:phosphoglucomutase